MTLLRTHRSLRRGTIATAIVVSLFAPVTTAVAADAPASAVNTKLSRIVLGIGSDATQANVSWQSKTNELQYLEYWPADNAADKTSVESPRGEYNAAIFYPHEATMTGLEPDTEYVYRVGNDDRGWSEERTLTTGEDSDSWSFLAMADAQIGVDAKIDEQSAAWNKAVNVATGEHPDSAFLMHLGDQVEGWGAAVKQLEEFTAPEALQNYRLAVLKGNHETYTRDRHFQDTYFLPNEDGASANYFFNYNNVLFIGLDGNRTSAADIEAHAKFVNDAIADHGADADWVMVGIHQAPFSQGTHYTDSDVVRLRKQLTPKLSEAGVDLVLSGHDHIYTRTHLMNGFDPVIPEGAAKSGDVLIPEDGEVLYLTSTTATGGKYYDFQDESGETHPNIREERARDLAHDSTARWRQDYNPDYTNIEVSPTELKLTTYNINTPYVVDQVTLQKKDAQKPEEKPEETTKPTSEQKPTTKQKPAPEVVTTTQTSEKLVPTTKTSVGTATVTETSVQTTPATKTMENTKTVPTTVKETVTETSSVEVPTTITKNAEPEEPAGDSDADNTGKDAAGSVSGSSTGGIILTVLAILIAVLGAIFAALSYVHPQWIQDIRKQFNI
ncbi:fibronectin type III domain-containing protein [Corynebacterium pilbarense]|uniref:Fibronectin type III domain-containing protein n=1 Tax=Corynebacterium pilbarense TaxID=1288393 RepID=A0A9Q4IHY3_9CORY|nr:FN3 domain-containing metallophosphoesterase family protein [Corynebacterium pilbarense]MCZ2221464.1 fibronectin type III domain-containing protein [Corynebacterium pilbarense]